MTYDICVMFNFAVHCCPYNNDFEPYGESKGRSLRLRGWGSLAALRMTVLQYQWRCKSRNIFTVSLHTAYSIRQNWRMVNSRFPFSFQITTLSMYLYLYIIQNFDIYIYMYIIQKKTTFQVCLLFGVTTFGGPPPSLIACAVELLTSTRCTTLQQKRVLEVRGEMW